MYLLSVKITPITRAELLFALAGFLEDGKKHHLVTTNPEFIVEAAQNAQFKEVINSADISLIDGIGILAAVDFINRKKDTKSGFLSLAAYVSSFIRVAIKKEKVVVGNQELEKISGVDLVLLLVQQEWMKQRKVFLLGGQENVSARALHRLQQINPDIVFRSSGGVKNIKQKDEKENAAVIASINNFQPDVLLVAYGHPWQDLWISQYKEQLSFKIAIGVGGTFDYLSGRVKRAPRWMRNVGMEWIYRLLKQPGRSSRIRNATWVFVQKIIKEGYLN